MKLSNKLTQFVYITLSSALLSCGHLKTAPFVMGASSANETPVEQEKTSSSGSHVSKSKEFFIWPVEQVRLSRGFLPNKKRPHLGLDLTGPKGAKIMAAHDGFVVYTGNAFHGFGKMVLIEGDHGWATLYAHLTKITVKEGDQVSQGEEIGKMGRTGRASGVHLHFEIRKDKGPVNPLAHLPNLDNIKEMAELRGPAEELD